MSSRQPSAGVEIWSRSEFGETVHSGQRDLLASGLDTGPIVLVGADGTIPKSPAANQPFDGERRVSRDVAADRIPPERMEAAASGLERRDLPLVGMLLNRRPVNDIVQVSGVDSAELSGRVRRIVEIRHRPPRSLAGPSRPGLPFS